MSGATHTKGPWAVRECPKLYAVDCLEIGGGPILHTDNLANARLIAAAPDLLEAISELLSNPHVDLGDLVYHIREREGEGWDGPAVKAWSEAITKAKAAIAKATGKESS